MERNLRRLKDQPYPKAPHNAHEIIDAYTDEKILSNFAYNLSNTDKLYIDTITTNTYCFTLFASMENIKLVDANIPPNMRNYSMDATFKIVPKSEFKQLLIIYIEYKNDVSR